MGHKITRFKHLGVVLPLLFLTGCLGSKGGGTQAPPPVKAEPEVKTPKAEPVEVPAATKVVVPVTEDVASVVAIAAPAAEVKVVPEKPAVDECLSRINGEESFIVNPEACEIPQSLEETQGGFPEAPVVNCPRPSKYYSDLLDRLNGLKLQIKNEACRETKDEVEKDLASLISTDRQEFVSLIKQGMFGQGQLDESQVQTVKNYVSNVVGKAKSIADSLNISIENKACFEEEDKQSALSFVGSAISEVSGALGAVAGPFGAKIALGGALAGQLLVSVGKIVDENKTYDFDDPEDVKNYFNSLCTYYDFKSELDGEANFMKKPGRIQQALELIEGNYDDIPGFIATARENCPICELIIDDYFKRQRAKVGYSMDGVSPLDKERGHGTDLGSAKTPNTEILTGQIAAGDLSYEDMARIYAKQFGDNWDNISLPEPEPKDERGALVGPPNGEPVLEPSPVIVEAPVVVEESTGFSSTEIEYQPPYKETGAPLPKQVATIRAMQLMTWLQEEQQRDAENRRQRIGSDLRSHVNRSKDQLEEVLVKKIPKYIDHIMEILEEDIDNITRYSFRANQSLRSTNRMYQIPEDENFWYRDPREQKASYPVVLAFNELWRTDFDFTEIFSSHGGDMSRGHEGFVDHREDLKDNLEILLSDLIDSHQLVVKKCEFFENSFFVKSGRYKRRIKNKCRESKELLAQSQDIIYEISELTNYGYFHDYSGSTLEIIFESRPNYVVDWIDSVIFALKRDTRYLQSGVGLVVIE